MVIVFEITFVTYYQNNHVKYLKQEIYTKNKNEIAQVSNIMITHDSYVTHR